MSTGAKVVVITNWSDETRSEYFFDLRDLGLKIERGEKAIITDLYDPDFKAELS